MQKVVADRYRLLDLIGRGGFGDVYRAEDVKVPTSSVVVKLEQKSAEQGVLIYESKILDYLQGVPGVPAVYQYGSERDHAFLAMEYCGSAISSIHKVCGNRFDCKTVAVLAKRMLETLEGIHGKYILHRDLKPENMMFDGRTGRFFLIDYGLSKRFVDQAGRHIVRSINKSFRGTLRYCSLNMHNGVENTRRDDLESLAYVLVYLLKGSLPWMNAKVGCND